MNDILKNKYLLSLLFAGLLFLPVIAGDYLLRVIIVAGIYVILTLSLNLVTGYTGQFCLGWAAFYGIGAYTSALLAINLKLSFWIGLPVAGIMAAKRTSELIPLCHLLQLTKCTVDFELLAENGSYAVQAQCLVKTTGKTGVEMEALTGVQIALLTIYDMCKAVDKAMVITDVHLLSKAGGKSGDFVWKQASKA